MITVHHYEIRDGLPVCKYCGGVENKDVHAPRWCPRTTPKIETRAVCDDKDPIIPAGTSPLPYGQVGMVLSPKSAVSWPPEFRHAARWRVTDIWEDGRGHTMVSLSFLGKEKIIERTSQTTRDMWTLAEEFDPNGCEDCGCTSVPCGCEDEP